MVFAKYRRISCRSPMRYQIVELEGTVCNGVVVPDNSGELTEGARVSIVVKETTKPESFGSRYARFKGAIEGLPADLAEQHDHYRLGTPKR